MSRLEQGGPFSPSPAAVEVLRETLQRLGFVVAETDARSLVAAVLAVEGPRLQLQVRGTLENSLEIIRDTAQAALGGLKEPPLREAKGRLERSDLTGSGRRPAAARNRVEPPSQELGGEEPRPVFKRPRR